MSFGHLLTEKITVRRATPGGSSSVNGWGDGSDDTADNIEELAAAVEPSMSVGASGNTTQRTHGHTVFTSVGLNAGDEVWIKPLAEVDIARDPSFPVRAPSSAVSRRSSLRLFKTTV